MCKHSVVMDIAKIMLSIWRFIKS